LTERRHRRGRARETQLSLMDIASGVYHVLIMGKTIAQVVTTVHACVTVVGKSREMYCKGRQVIGALKRGTARVVASAIPGAVTRSADEQGGGAAAAAAKTTTDVVEAAEEEFQVVAASASRLRVRI
jgi:hypothetical protein